MIYKKQEWLCNECTSSNITIFKPNIRNTKEMDCYCHDCNSENYIVSSSLVFTKNGGFSSPEHLESNYENN